MESAAGGSTLFDVIGDEGWSSLRGHMDRREYAPGELLIARGTLEPEFHVIHEGLVSVEATSPQGVRRQLGALGPGDAVGDMSLLTGEPASADVVASTDVVTFAIAQERLASVGDARSRLIEALASMLAARLRHANDRLLAQHSAEIHAIVCRPADAPALVRLPAEVARTVNAAVLAVLAGDAFDSGLADAMAADGVSVWKLGDHEVADLPRMLRRVAHEYDRIIIFSTEPLIAEAYEVTTSAVLLHEAERFEGPDGIDAPQSAPQAVIALTSRPWSVTTLRELTQRAGAPVIAAIPSGESKHGPGDPVAKLARVITKRQVGVALGAGAAKGIAHLGVLRALDTLGVDIDMFSGSSIGAAIAAGRAAGYDHDELSDIATRIAARAVRPTLPLHSFLSNRGLRDELERIGQGRRFEDLDLPLAVCATDIFRRCDVTFTTGPVWPRILASMAIPGIYPALRGRNSYLVDGAVLNPVPTTQCRELGAGVVIGVRLTGRQTSPRDDLDVMPSRPLATETIMRCLEIMHNRVSELSGTDADATIQVCIDKGGLRDFSRSSEIADAGYAATMEARDSLAAAMPYIGKASP